jgi:hypothetical protein
MTERLVVLLALCHLGACARAPLVARPEPARPQEARSFELPAEPNGLWWDGASRALYFAGDESHAIYRWRDAGDVRSIATLPAPPEGKAGLGQPVVLGDGTIVVTRFGHGVAGGILVVRPDGSSALVPGLDPARRRIGLAVAADGALYDSWFLFDEAAHSFHGAVSRLALDGGETDVLTGLAKPVGVLVVGGQLYVSDQEGNRILRAPLASPGAAQPFVANLEAPDLLCAGPGGAIFAGGKLGVVYRIAPDGSVARVAGGYRAVRGVAYDAAGKRLFVVERRGREPPRPATLHELPVAD